MNSAHAAPAAAGSSMGPREWAALLILSVLWGGSFFFYKVLVVALPPLTLVLGRVGIAALLLHGLLVARSLALPRSARLWRLFLVMGLLNNVVPFTLIAWGEISISSALASILNATTPVFTVLIAHVATLSERLNWHKGVGVLLGFLGVVLLLGGRAFGAWHTQAGLGALACIGAAVAYACAAIFGRQFRGIEPLVVATGQLTASTLLLIPLACLADQPWRLPPPGAHTWAALIGIAALCTALAYIVYFRLLAAAGATNVLLVTLLVPVSALVLGILFLGESVSPSALGGLGLIGLGLLAIDGRVLAFAAGGPRRRT